MNMTNIETGSTIIPTQVASLSYGYGEIIGGSIDTVLHGYQTWQSCVV